MFGKSSSSSNSNSSEPTPAQLSSAANRFSLLELRKLHTQLVENKIIDDNNQHLVIEILRVIAEMVVYGDNKSELLFDYFCEKNMLSLFVELMKSEHGCPSIVHIQILQTLSILISCVRNETSLYYLLSNNYINEIIIYPHDYLNDESLCAQFASFMKSLSLKLNIYTVQFFFIEETGAFPILTKAVELLTIPEPMVRIACQSTILNVYRVDDSRAIAYALQDDVLGFLCRQVIEFMEDQYLSIVKVSTSYFQAYRDRDETSCIKLEGRLEDLISGTEDWFYYLQDLLDLEVPLLRKALTNSIVTEYCVPILLVPVLKHHRQHLLYKPQQQLDSNDHIDLTSSLSYILQMLRIVTHQSFQRAILFTLFHPLSINSRDRLLQQEGNNNTEGNTYSPLSSSSSSSSSLSQGGGGGGGVFEPNSMKQAWDRLPLHGNQKVLLLQASINHLLLDSIVSASHSITADKSPSMNSSTFEYELQENYVQEQAAMTTPNIRSVAEAGRDEVLSILQCLCILPRMRSSLCPSSSPDQVKVSVDDNNDDVVDNDEDEVSSSEDQVVIGDDTSIVCLEDVSVEAIDELLVPIIMTRKESSLNESSSSSSSTQPRLKLGRNDMLQPKASTRMKQLINSDPLALSTLFKIDTIIANRLDDQSKLSAYMLFDVLENYSKYSPSIIQLVSHTVYKLAICVHKVLQSSSSSSCSSIIIAQQQHNQRRRPHHVVNSSVMASPSDSSSVLEEEEEEGDRQDSKDHLNKRRDDVVNYRDVLLFILSHAYKIARGSVEALLQRLDGPQSENILILIKEELSRLEHGRWKRFLQKNYRNNNHFLPYSDELFNMDKMSDSYQLPTNQIDGTRRDIQVFLLFRSLYKKINQLAACNGDAAGDGAGATMSSMSRGGEYDDNLFSSISDRDFLCVDQANLSSSSSSSPLLATMSSSSSSSFDMRGKRFLDVKRIPLPSSGRLSKDGSDAGSASADIRDLSAVKVTTSPNGSVTRNRNSWGSSLLGFGSNEKNQKKSVTATATTTTSPSSSSSSTMNTDSSESSSPLREKLLFVQDQDMLLLISCDKQDPRSGFKVYLSAPLMYTDAIFDSADSTKFKVIVRSSQAIANMTRVESSAVNDVYLESVESMSKVGVGKRTDDLTQFLKPHVRTDMWQLMLKVDNQQAANLAVNHIVKRREEIQSQRKTKLREMLNRWICRDAMSTESTDGL